PVKEKSTYETGRFLMELEKEMGFAIRCVQVDNGSEFVNDEERTQRTGRFQKIAEQLGIQIRRIRPYSPWQNGKVERSHREDGKILYARKVFTSEKQLRQALEKHQKRYNTTAKTCLNLKSPNQVVSEYFSKV
ncbi:integrase core domain-containing protein, partial [Bacteroides heparinolyticus]|uniref:integrase core domain-containing protein n=1 Tax=Prevotella heparinolytica TaxID=28113 RepID=UPI0035A13C6B